MVTENEQVTLCEYLLIAHDPILLLNENINTLNQCIDKKRLESTHNYYISTMYIRLLDGLREFRCQFFSSSPGFFYARLVFHYLIFQVLQSKQLLLKIQMISVRLSCILCKTFESLPSSSSLANAQVRCIRITSLHLRPFQIYSYLFAHFDISYLELCLPFLRFDFPSLHLMMTK